MHKLFISATAAGCVLFSGLVSCSKEKTKTDVYAAPPPVILSQSGSYELKAWDQLKTKDLDAQDSFDFSGSMPASISIQAQCRHGKDYLNGQSSFKGTTRVQVWQVLPAEMLATWLTDYECSFTVVLVNSAGSQHIYHIDQVPVVDMREWPVVLLPNGGGKLPNPLLSRNFSDVRLRYQNTSAAAAKFICRNLETMPLPFERVIDISHFEFISSALEIHPRQSCRAQIIENGIPSAMSALATLQISPPPLEFIPLSSFAPLVNRDAFVAQMQRIYGREPITLAKWRVENGSPVSRFLRIPKAEIEGMVQLYQRFLPQESRSSAYGDWQQMTLAVRATKLIPEGSVTVTAQDPSFTTIKLGPKQALTLAAVFQSHSVSTCLSIYVPPSNYAIFSGFKPVVIEELGMDGSDLGSYPLKIPDEAMGFAMPSAKEPVKDMHPCEWN